MQPAFAGQLAVPRTHSLMLRLHPIPSYLHARFPARKCCRANIQCWSTCTLIFVYSRLLTGPYHRDSMMEAWHGNVHPGSMHCTSQISEQCLARRTAHPVPGVLLTHIKLQSGTGVAKAGSSAQRVATCRLAITCAWASDQHKPHQNDHVQHV